MSEKTSIELGQDSGSQTVDSEKELKEFLQEKLKIQLTEEDVVDSRNTKNNNEQCRHILGEAWNRSVEEQDHETFSLIIDYMIQKSLPLLRNEGSKTSLKPQDGPNDELIAAAENESLIDMWKLLKPEDIFTNIEDDNDDPIQLSHSYLRKFKIQASATYLILTQSNPIAEALKLSSKFQKFMEYYPELKEMYQNLSSNCSKIAVDLINCCDSVNEVIRILKQPAPKEDKHFHDSALKNSYKYPLLVYAVWKEEKDFIAHSNVQFALKRLWMEPHMREARDQHCQKQTHRIERQSTIETRDKLSHTSLRMEPQSTTETHDQLLQMQNRKSENVPRLLSEPKGFCDWIGYILLQSFPIAILLILLSPIVVFRKEIGIKNKKLAQFLEEVRIPLNRYIYFAESYILFLVFLVITSTDSSDSNTFFYIRWYDWIIGSYTLGLIIIVFFDWILAWRHKEFPFFWTIYETVMVMIMLSGTGCFLVASATFYIEKNLGYEILLSISLFVLTGEFLYAIGICLAFMRILQWFCLSSGLGYIIVSISQMITVIGRLFIIFIVVIFSFMQGLHLLYKDYELKDQADDNKGAFINYRRTSQAFFWALFGQGDADLANIPDDAERHVTRNISLTGSTFYRYIPYVGESIWGLFHIALVLILLNILIAVMTKCYDQASENCETEWKYARTQLWLYYFEKNSPFPPPLNIITSLVKGIYRWVISKDDVNRHMEDLELNQALVKRLLYNRAFSSTNKSKNSNSKTPGDFFRFKESFKHEFMQQWQ